ncbi:hypothetical protein [uncultured Amphritea sp.]|uniref:hypothetical protein n=1 Tax=uncultured Amphritea sp. TaxID=981605 RepID=UPI00262CF1EA|nr:hypothetical protein [uncultured Amphritea sp.]
MFQDLEKELEGVAKQEDRLGGGGYLVNSGVYDATVKMAYITPASSSKAQCMNIVLEVDGKEVRERVWFTNREGKPTYTKDGKKFMLPGYETINDLCLVTTGHPFSEQTVEEKVIKVYDYEAKGEVEKALPVVTSILTKPLLAGVLMVRENKQEKNSAGDYVNIAETRDFNEFDKFFHKDTRKTVPELKRGGDIAEEDMFITLWAEKNTGEIRDRSKPVAGSGPAKAAGGAAGGGGKSLFAN